jgi:SAM-dependent methyltransferase
VLTGLQHRILRRISPAGHQWSSEQAYTEQGKLTTLLGETLVREVSGKIVLDFGCGRGLEAIDLARRGAAKVIGIDIRQNALARARDNAQQAGMQDICEFGTSYNGPVDIIVSIDSFEHFADPAAVLREMQRLLRPSGFVALSFGPPWYHPYGGHLFSGFPWAHVLFSEEALVRWRSDFSNDGATRFCEVEGGLNQMTIGRFEKIARDSGFQIQLLETVPIKKLAWMHNRLTREFTTSIIRAKLVKRPMR